MKAFIHGGCSVKCKYYQDLVITYQKDLTWTHEESWKPYQFMVSQYGPGELMRRVQKGSIATRKDERGEWEFKFVENKDKHTEKLSGKFQGTSSGNLDSKQWQQLMDSGFGKDMIQQDGQSKEAVNFLKALPGNSKVLKESDVSHDGDEELEDAIDSLSDLGSMGRNIMTRVKDAVVVTEKAMRKASPKHKSVLALHLKALEALKSGKDTAEAHKLKLIAAMQDVKKAVAHS